MEIAGIRKIKKIVELIQKVDCTKYAMITDTAKEMGVKKTALMELVDNNPKLFDLVEVGKKGKTIGLGISRVYLSAEENPKTEEWLEVKKKEWDKKIHIGARIYYNCLEYWFIPEEDGKEGEYRNTPEKIQELADAGVIKKIRTCYGGLGDAYHEEVFIFNDEVKKAIEDYGWTTDFNK